MMKVRLDDGNRGVRAGVVLVATLLSMPMVTLGKNVYVNNVTGSDQYDGSAPAHKSGQAGPVKSVAHGVALLKTSDDLIIANTHKPYHASVVLAGKGGTAADPMVIEGNGATIEALAVRPADQWKVFKGDIVSTEWRAPWGFLVVADGAKPMLGRSLESLKPGESFFDFKNPVGYYRLPQGKKLEQVRLEIPSGGEGATASGVIVANASNISVRNIHSRYFWDDGFDIYGHSFNLRYENIEASYCGDQGFSAHDYGSAVIVNDNLHDNDSAVADTEYSRTTYIGLRGYDNNALHRGYTVCFQGGEHALIDSRLWNNPYGVVVDPAQGFEQHPGDKMHPYNHARVWLYNDLIEGGEYGLKVEYDTRDSVAAEHVTFARVKDGIIMRSSKNEVHLLNCIVDATDKALAGFDGYFGDYNCWRPGKAEFNGKELTAEQWQKLEPRSIFADPKLADHGMALATDSPARGKAWVDSGLEQWLRRSEIWNGQGTGGFLRNMGAELSEK
jgi:hypothetical protein